LPRESRHYSLLKEKIKDSFVLSVGSSEAGQRIDSFIAGHLPQYSRSQAVVLIRQGHILVDGQSCKPGHRVKSNESIVVRIPPAAPVDLVAEPLPLNILFEDADIIVIDKPAGMVVHPAVGHRTGTLVHGILYHCPDLEGIGAEKRPGIVHRLDKDTSGVMVVAKNARAHDKLSLQFKSRCIEKHYLALVFGSPKTDSGRVDLPIGRHPVERKKMSTRSRRGRDALTLWKVRERFTGVTLIDVELKTGRTHQIRVHCHAMGFPIIGDPVYGRKGAIKQMSGSSGLPLALKNVKRQMLHAYKIGFKHPHDGQLLSFRAPLPKDIAHLLEQLQGFKEP
jgi:23S rRNA pseudouridine1911/1915/1917 synthase